MSATITLLERKSIPKPDVTFAFTKILPQNFPHPDTMMFYIKKNPTTPNLCINLLKSCKYFYSKNDLLLPLNSLQFDKYSRFNIGEIIRSKKDPIKYKLPFNVWLIDCLSLNDRGQEIFEHYYFDNFYFFHHAVRCTLKQLHLYYQRITFEQFQFLTENGLAKFFSFKTTVSYSNGTVVPVEKIFTYLKNIKYVHYIFGKENAELVTAETTKNLLKSIDTSMLQRFLLQWIPSNFDFELFKKFTEAHTNVFFYIDTYPH